MNYTPAFLIAGAVVEFDRRDLSPAISPIEIASGTNHRSTVNELHRAFVAWRSVAGWMSPILLTSPTFPSNCACTSTDPHSALQHTPLKGHLRTIGIRTRCRRCR